jgi:hypothetical protein
MALIIVAIAVQAFASRKDPAAMAATRWLGLSVIVGAGAFIGNVAVPIALGMRPFLDPRFSLGFFVIIYVGMAVGLRRHRCSSWTSGRSASCSTSAPARPCWRWTAC